MVACPLLPVSFVSSWVKEELVAVAVVKEELVVKSRGAAVVCVFSFSFCLGHTNDVVMAHQDRMMMQHPDMMMDDGDREVDTLQDACHHMVKSG